MKIKLCPSGKHAYPDAASAWRTLCAMRNGARHAVNFTRRCPRRIYECPHCGFWHLTSVDRYKETAR